MSTHVGNPDQAIAHFENALAFCRKAGYRPGLAWTCCDYLLEADVPFAMEKPMGLNLQQVEDLAELAERKRAFVAVPF